VKVFSFSLINQRSIRKGIAVNTGLNGTEGVRTTFQIHPFEAHEKKTFHKTLLGETVPLAKPPTMIIERKKSKRKYHGAVPGKLT
jgi:hypothetical protein